MAMWMPRWPRHRTGSAARSARVRRITSISRRQSSWAYIDADGLVQVTSSTQHPSETQAIVAHVLGLPANRVVCRCLRMGGGFGGKETQANAFAALVALAATLTGRPAGIQLPRSLDMQLTGKRHPFLGRFEVGFDDDGRLLGLRADLVSDGGWSCDLSPPVLLRALVHIDNAYHYAGRRDHRPHREDPPALEHRLPWFRWPAGHADRRGDPRSRRPPPRPAAAPRPRAQLLRRGAAHALWPAGRGQRDRRRLVGAAHAGRTSTRAGRSAPRSTPPAANASAGSRSRRSSSASPSTRPSSTRPARWSISTPTAACS
jgi:hypothetical protein